MFYGLYHYLTRCAAPFLKWHLQRRLKKGKEDPSRISERFGGASFSRPEGDLVWFHAASVGESLAILPLISRLAINFPILVTTGTVTSARLMVQRLPSGCFHQYIPLDVPFWVERFLAHWQPRVGVFVESELWPNLLFEAKKRHISLVLINAQMSKKSFQLWRWARPLIRQLLAAFQVIFAQDERSQERYNKLGAIDVRASGNLKFAADPPPYSPKELARLREEIGNRPVWAAVSTHPGEEELMVVTAQALKQKFPNLLTILVPRHPERAAKIQEMLQAPYVLRTSGEPITPCHDFVLWDTIGEVGLIFRLASISFIGGSLTPNGGHNPIEALLAGSCPIMGPHTKNFETVVEKLRPAIITVKDATQLTEVVEKFLINRNEIENYISAGQQIIQDQQHNLEMILTTIEFLARQHG
jgi:3-deoxy-D-manno-octulosonic-acid transferase